MVLSEEYLSGIYDISEKYDIYCILEVIFKASIIESSQNILGWKGPSKVI